MTPRRLDWRAVQPKLRKIDELLGRLHQLGEFDEKRLQTGHVDALAVERILTLEGCGRRSRHDRVKFGLCGESGLLGELVESALV
ncbi:MAG: hypothetical protein ACRDRP_21250, partial [Pseudonocardiaceae bacterium]